MKVLKWPIILIVILSLAVLALVFGMNLPNYLKPADPKVYWCIAAPPAGSYCAEDTIQPEETLLQSITDIDKKLDNLLIIIEDDPDFGKIVTSVNNYPRATDPKGIWFLTVNGQSIDTLSLEGFSLKDGQSIRLEYATLD